MLAVIQEWLQIQTLVARGQEQPHQAGAQDGQAHQQVFLKHPKGRGARFTELDQAVEDDLRIGADRRAGHWTTNRCLLTLTFHGADSKPLEVTARICSMNLFSCPWRH
jgi:hypothetical protein